MGRPQQRLTEDLKQFCDTLSDLFPSLLKPLVELAFCPGLPCSDGGGPPEGFHFVISEEPDCQYTCGYVWGVNVIGGGGVGTQTTTAIPISQYREEWSDLMKRRPNRHPRFGKARKQPKYFCIVTAGSTR